MPAPISGTRSCRGCAGGRVPTMLCMLRVPAWRRVNGFAVAAPCLLYNLYIEYGVAAPGLLS